VIDRLCRECGKKFVGERNTCPACHNLARRKNGKFGAEYHRNYYHKRYSKSAMLHNQGDLTKQGPIAELRKATFEKQKFRIRAELAAIVCAGLDPANDTIETIEKKVVLGSSFLDNKQHGPFDTSTSSVQASSGQAQSILQNRFLTP
jgi:hypothetical protein